MRLQIFNQPSNLNHPKTLEGAAKIQFGGHQWQSWQAEEETLMVFFMKST